MSEKYTKKYPNKFWQIMEGLHPGLPSASTGESEDLWQKEVDEFNALPLEERRKRVIQSRKDKLKMAAGGLVIPAIGTGLAFAANAGAKPNNAPNNTNTPIEKQGDHFGITHTHKSGTGVIHTEKGSYGIGKAVAAEAQDGGPIVEHTVK